MVEQQPSKLNMRVRFPLPAPAFARCASFGWASQPIEFERRLSRRSLGEGGPPHFSQENLIFARCASFGWASQPIEFERRLSRRSLGEGGPPHFSQENLIFARLASFGPARNSFRSSLASARSVLAFFLSFPLRAARVFVSPAGVTGRAHMKRAQGWGAGGSEIISKPDFAAGARSRLPNPCGFGAFFCLRSARRGACRQMVTRAPVLV